ncbi:MAG: hypothetical protein WC812_02915 [Candidatus Pacearchaeota archaeon]|jgi:hypothetical protein
MNNIDEFLEDGFKIREYENNLSKIISEIKRECEVQKEEDFDYKEHIEISVNVLKTFLEGYKKLIEKYPDSKFIKNRKKYLYFFAKKNLPKEVYKEVYENEQH